MKSAAPALDAPKWDIYPACDIALGEDFRTQPHLQNRYIKVDIRATQECLEQISPDSYGGSVRLVASHPASFPSDSDGTTTLTIDFEGVKSVKCRISVGGLLYPERLCFSPLEELTIHELQHVVDSHNPAIIWKESLVRASLMVAPFVSAIALAGFGVNIAGELSEYSKQDSVPMALLLGSVGLLAGEQVTRGLIRRPWLGRKGQKKSVWSHHTPMEKRAYLAEIKHKGVFAPIFSLEEIHDTTDA